MDGGPGLIGEGTGITLKLVSVITGTALAIAGALSGLVAWVRRRDLEEINMRIAQLERTVEQRLDAAQRAEGLRVERIDQLISRVELSTRETESRITARITELAQQIMELRTVVIHRMSGDSI